MASLPRILSPRRRRLLLRLLAIGLGQAGLAFGLAWLLRAALGLFAGEAGGALLQEVAILGGLLLGAGAVIALRTAERVEAERLGQDYVMRVRLRLFDGLLLAPARIPGGGRLGLTMTRLITDLNSLKNWVSFGIARATVAAVSVGGSILALAYYAPELAISAAVAVALCAGAAAALALPLRSRVQAARRERGRLAGHLGEKAQAAVLIRQVGALRRERRRVRRRSERLTESLIGRMRIAGLLRALPEAVLPLFLVLSLTQIAWLSVDGRMVLGDLAAALLIVGMISGSLRDLAQALDYRLNYEEARRRLTTALARPRLREPAKALALGPAEALELAYEQVSVAGVLESVSLAIAPGERVLLAGPSGAGKSTLLALAARLADPDQGRVRVGGRPVDRLSFVDLGRAVRLVSPELPLQRGSVADNIATGGSTDPAGIEALARLCGLGEDAKSLAAVLATRVAEQGQNLASGLRARIRLARALAARPGLLLIDEPELLADRAGRALLERVLAFDPATTVIAAGEPVPVDGIERVVDLVAGAIVRSSDAPPADVPDQRLRIAS